MSDYTPTKPQVEVPDLLAALTAHGLLGQNLRAAFPVKRARASWLARWLEQRFVLDDEWAGAC